MAMIKESNKINIVKGTKQQIEDNESSIPNNSLMLITDEELATVATSGSYNDLTNKPTIPPAYTLPQATGTILGGVKANARTTEDLEVKIDTTTGILYSKNPTNNIIIVSTTNPTVLPAWANSTVIFTSNSNISLKVPQSIEQAFEAGFWFDAIQYGTGELTFTNTGVVVNSNNGMKTVANQYQAVTLIKIDSANEWLLVGGLKE